jgi:fructose-specific phosphotransferase system IIC component
MSDRSQPTRNRAVLTKCLLGGLVLGVCAAALLVLVPAASSGDWYEWIDSALFLGLPVIALGTLAGTLLGGVLTIAQHRRRAATRSR